MKVSVLLTAYNATWCIERSLDSVFAQTRLPDEVLVADDGSEDDTVDLIGRRYGSRVRVVRLPHRGLTVSRRASVDAATGDWFSVLDADDWWEPTKLERQLTFLAAHPEVRWCGTDGDYVSAEGVIRASWMSDYVHSVRELTGDMLPLLVERCFPLVSSMLIERGAYTEVGGYDLSIPYSQDYGLWLKLASRFPGGFIAEPLIHYWSSPNQLSRRLEARYRDDLGLMRRVESGEFRRDPKLQRRGEQRAAAIAFDLAIVYMRDGRVGEARELLAAARRHGPLKRRLLAWGGSLAPGPILGPLMRWPLLKRAVAASRAATTRIVDPARTASLVARDEVSEV